MEIYLLLLLCLSFAYIIMDKKVSLGSRGENKMKALHSRKKIQRFAKKRWIFIIGFILLLSAIVVSTHNASFYQKSIVKVTKVEEEFLRKEQGPNGEVEKYFHQKISAILCNGKNKGEKVSLGNNYSSTGYKTTKYRKGDSLFVTIDHAKVKTKDKIIGVKRDYLLVLLVGLFLWGLILVATKKGLMTILSVIINLGVFIFCIRFMKDPEVFSKIWMFMILTFCSITLLLVGGLHKKTWGALVASLLTIWMVWGIYHLVIGITKEPPYELMEYISGPHEIANIFMASVITGSLGAVMDVAITITSSVNELIVTTPKITIKELISSVREIGMDIMGTMINVLFFVYMSATVTRVLLESRNGFGFMTIIRFNVIFELIRFLLGAIGIVLAIPVSGVLAVTIFRKNRRTKE